MKVILTTLQSLRNLLITQDSLRKYIVLLIFIISCNYNIKNNDGYVARLGDDFLSIDQVKNQIPNNLTNEDSLKMANKIIEEWATSKLLILNAQINLTETERIEIESKSEKYRENLITSESNDRKEYTDFEELNNNFQFLDVGRYDPVKKSVNERKINLIDVKKQGKFVSDKFLKTINKFINEYKINSNFKTNILSDPPYPTLVDLPPKNIKNLL